MLSTTVDDILRNDEDTSCANLKNYETDSGYSGSGSASGGSYYQGPGYSSGGGWGGMGGGYSSGVDYNSRRGFQSPTRGPRRTREAGIESDVEILDPSLQ